jgi:hypothetical protein
VFAWILAASAAWGIEVCPTNAPCTVDCDACTLAEAVDTGEHVIQLRPGPHRVWGELVVDHRVALTGDPEAWLVPADFAGRVLFTAQASGSELHDLRVVGESSWYGPTLVFEIEADDFFAHDLSFEDMLINSTALQIRSQNVRLEELTFQALYGEGLLNVGEEASVEVVGLTLQDNLAFEAALQVRGGTLTIQDTTIDHGEAIYGASSLMFSASDATLVLDGVQMNSETPSSYWTILPPRLLQAEGGKLVVKNLTISGSTPMTGPAISITGASSFLLSDSTLQSVAHSVEILETDEVIVERTTFDALGKSSLSLREVDLAEIRDSWFCGSGSDVSGGAIALVDSCSDGCIVERGVFVDSFSNGDGGAIYAGTGDLTISRSTFQGSFARGTGESVLVGPEVDLWIDHSLFTGGVVGDPVLAGGLTLLDWVASDGPLITGGWPQDEHVLQGMSPRWIEETPSRCGESVLLADDPANDWLIEHRVGAFVPCWIDADGDGRGGEFLPESAFDCEAAGLVSVGGDCDDADGDRVSGWGCDPDDHDGDGVKTGVDCNDRDVDIGECRMSWSGGCATRSAGPPLLAPALLALLALRWRRKAG